jgi:hypothetical protein
LSDAFELDSDLQARGRGEFSLPGLCEGQLPQTRIWKHREGKQLLKVTQD